MKRIAFSLVSAAGLSLAAVPAVAEQVSVPAPDGTMWVMQVAPLGSPAAPAPQDAGPLPQVIPSPLAEVKQAVAAPAEKAAKQVKGTVTAEKPALPADTASEGTAPSVDYLPPPVPMPKNTQPKAEAKPAANKPASDKPAVKKPAVKKPAAKKQVVRKPAVQQPEAPTAIALPEIKPAMPAVEVDELPAPVMHSPVVETFGMSIIPAAVGPDTELSSRYLQIYNSIPFNRAEYVANPAYRHDATMELLTGNPRPTAGYTGRTVQNRQYTGYRPYIPSNADYYRFRYPVGYGLYGFGRLPYHGFRY